LWETFPLTWKVKHIATINQWKYASHDKSFSIKSFFSQGLLRNHSVNNTWAFEERNRFISLNEDREYVSQNREQDLKAGG